MGAEEQFERSGGQHQSGSQVDQIDVVHHYVRIVLLPPFLCERAIEPGIIGRNEVAPLQNLQRFLLSLGALWKKKGRSRAGCQCTGARQLDEFSPRNSTVSLLRHRSPPIGRNTTAPRITCLIKW